MLLLEHESNPKLTPILFDRIRQKTIGIRQGPRLGNKKPTNSRCKFVKNSKKCSNRKSTTLEESSNEQETSHLNIREKYWLINTCRMPLNTLTEFWIPKISTNSTSSIETTLKSSSRNLRKTSKNQKPDEQPKRRSKKAANQHYNYSSNSHARTLKAIQWRVPTGTLLIKIC